MKKNLRSVCWILALLCMGATVACSDQGDDDLFDGGGSSSISDLPSATSEVSSASSSSFGKVTSLAAITGAKLVEAGTLTWTNGTHSRGMCETLNLAKNLYSEASQPDLIQCYIGAMVDAGLFDGTTAYSGSYNFYKLTGDPEMSGSARIKFKASRDAAGSVSGFEMFMCFGGTDASPSQDGYLSQTVSSSSSTITSVHIGSESGATFGGRLTVNGAISGGNWTSKTISATRGASFSGGGMSGSFGESVTLTQGASSISIDGYRAGQWLQSGVHGDTFSDSFYTVAQILNASTMSTFAIGDGTAKYNISWSGDNNGDGTNDASFNSGDQTQSWDGDTRQPLGTASDGDFFTAANAGTLATVGSTPSVSFSSSETWDCTGSFTTADLSQGGDDLFTALSACDSKYQADFNEVECYQLQ